MKHNKYFSPGLYLEGMRRLRLVGILFMVVLLLESIFLPLMTRVNIGVSPSTATVAEVVTGMNLQPALLMLVTVGMPILVLVLFAFYRSRAGSDFWHALPQTRLCQYVSLWAALLTWTVALILIPTAVSCGVSLLCAKSIAPLWSSVFQYALYVFAGCLLSGALATVAVTLTGTIFSSLVLYAIILFLPRILIMLVAGAVSSVLPIVPIASVLPFAQNWNLAVSAWTNGSLFASAMFGGATYGSTSALWYSLVLAVLATVCGGWLFCKRKSEAAQRSAPSRFLQALYRLLLAIMMFSPLVISVYTEIAQNGKLSDSVLFLFLFFLAIVVLLAYELITTRRWRNLLRVLPTVVIALALNAVLVCVLSANARLTLRFEPTKDEIESVSILSDDDRMLGNYTSDFSQYAMQAIRDEAFTDRALIELVAQRLAADNEALRNGTYAQTGSMYTGMDAYQYQTYTFRIVSKDGVRYRTLRIPLASESVIGELMAANEKYRATWLSLPQAMPNTAYTQKLNANLTDAQYTQILNSMREELQTVSFEDWFKVVNHPYEAAIEIFVYSFEQDGRAFRAELPLCADLMPKSTAEYFACYWDASRVQIEQLLDCCRPDGSMKDQNRMMEVSLVDPVENDRTDPTYVTFDLPNGLADRAELYRDLAEALRAEPIGSGDRYVSVSVVPYDDNTKIVKDTFGTPFYVKIDDPDGSLTERLIEAAKAD